MFTRRFCVNFMIKRYMCRRASGTTKDKLYYSSDLIWQTIENNKVKSSQDWKNIRHEILSSSGPQGFITSFNIDAMTLGICTAKKEYDLALSYFDFLKNEKFQLKLATVGKYFQLMYKKGLNDGITAQNEEQILMLYKNIRETYPVLDATTLMNIIQAVSLTKDWKLCVDLLNEVKVTAVPNSIAYSVVISAAFLNNDDITAWKLFKETLEQDRGVQDIVYSSYFEKVFKTCDKSEIFIELEKLFYFLQEHCLKIDYEVIADLKQVLNKINVKVHSSTVNQKGICTHCKSKLKPFDLSDDEFNELKSKIIQNVIVGKDVFHKTTSEELKNFQNFISTMENYDVVVDGLNVAYSAGAKQSSFISSGLVCAVVSYFVNQNKKVLVLGRNHMNHWPKQNWGYVLKNAAVFLTQDLSQDDPYLLYCALHSGKNTIIITKDLMRSHKFLLRNVQLKLLFDKWLSLRQYHLVYVQNSGVPVFKKPMPYSDVAQKNGHCWHIPYTLSTQERSSTSNSWLCIK